LQINRPTGFAVRDFVRLHRRDSFGQRDGDSAGLGSLRLHQVPSPRGLTELRRSFTGGNMKMRMRSILLMLASVAMLSVLAAVGKAQTSGEITGLVTDSSGAAVTGANVTTTNKATGATRKITTNGEGLYSFPSLLPGVYQLKVEQSGF